MGVDLASVANEKLSTTRNLHAVLTAYISILAVTHDVHTQVKISKHVGVKLLLNI